MVKTIGNPLSWTARVFGNGSRYVGEAAHELGGQDTAPIEIRTLNLSDLKQALRKGVDDFAALRTDVMFIVLIYPIVGLFLTWFAINQKFLPFLFPLVSGFALLGPVAAIGLYEMSRRRERGQTTSWGDAVRVIGSPSFVPILILGGYLFAIFIVWLLAAALVFNLTLGPELPLSASAFFRDVFTTGAGWAMLVFGVAVGGVFAALVLAISLVSFPLLLDRHVGIPRAVVTSLSIARQNPVPVALWGAIVVVFLGVGIATLFIGLVVVLPILGHATWHLYRAAVKRTDTP
jgi:uncharacterized membrane protein